MCLMICPIMYRLTITQTRTQERRNKFKTARTTHLHLIMILDIVIHISRISFQQNHVFFVRSHHVILDEII